MNIFGKTIIPFFLVAIMLASCNSSISTPDRNPTQVMETAITIVKTAAAETQIAVPTATATSTAMLLPSPSPSMLPPTAPSLPTSEQIVYYYFVQIPENAIPEGSVVIMPDLYILAPTLSDLAPRLDPAADLRTALETVLHDERNRWDSSDLEIINAAFREGHVDVALQGEYFGVAPLTLTAARTQILLTLFANAAVQTATVTLNGDNISNIDISHSMNAKPATYAYTRAEIETFITEHAYIQP